MATGIYLFIYIDKQVYGASDVPLARIRLYFGSKQRSLGGDLDHVDEMPDYDCHIIHFEDAEGICL